MKYSYNFLCVKVLKIKKNKHVWPDDVWPDIKHVQCYALIEMIITNISYRILFDSNFYVTIW